MIIDEFGKGVLAWFGFDYEGDDGSRKKGGGFIDLCKVR